MSGSPRFPILKPFFKRRLALSGSPACQQSLDTNFLVQVFPLVAFTFADQSRSL